jgi:cyclin L
MIYTALDVFYLSAAELEASPSRHDGVDAALESQLRRYGCDALAEAVVLLHLPQAVACTAQVLLHRFYCKRSLAEFDVKVVSIAAFWLGAKLEEVIEIDSPTKLRLRDILMVFYRVFRRKDNKILDILDPYSHRYDLLKTEVVRTERHVLRAFGFIVHVEHPHRFVLTFGQLLGLDKELLQEAWNLANDSLRIPLCVRHKSEVVACGLLFLAARRLSVPMPENPPWWEVFGVSQSQLLEVAVALVDLLKESKAVYVSVAGRDYTSKGSLDGGASSPDVLAKSVREGEERRGNGNFGAAPGEEMPEELPSEEPPLVLRPATREKDSIGKDGAGQVNIV